MNWGTISEDEVQEALAEMLARAEARLSAATSDAERETLAADLNVLRETARAKT